MPLPATRYTLPNVGASGNERPSPSACAHAEVDRLLWRSEHGYWKACHRLRTEIQCRFIRAISEATIQASSTQQTGGRYTRQCQIPPCAGATPHSTSPPQGTLPAVSATVQSRTQPDREGLETGAPVSHTQPALPDAGRCAGRGWRAFRHLGQAKSATGKTMRHNLSRYV